MKISSYHKQRGDFVEWYDASHGIYDIAYLARVFGDEYTKDISSPLNAKSVIRGGSGYAISIGDDGREKYDKDLDPDLPDGIEHMMPDYSLYGITDTAYGFLTKGCPRGCDFCHVKDMQGQATRTVARLSEFWNGQKNIKLLDPNLTASPEWRMHFQDLKDSKAYIDFTQGLDAR